MGDITVKNASIELSCRNCGYQNNDVDILRDHIMGCNEDEDSVTNLAYQLRLAEELLKQYKKYGKYKLK
jgi:hypothetical protein